MAGAVWASGKGTVELMPRGVSQCAKLGPQARLLREQGLTYREIGERLGVPKKTVCAWCIDPDGEKLKARKRSYGNDCELCGKRTVGDRGPGTAATICRDCEGWTDEQIIDAIRRWAEDHGGIPPRGQDWRRPPDGYPSASIIVRRIGWNNALLKAGFDLKCDRRAETQAEIEGLIRQGVPTAEIAERFGFSASNIHMRLKVRGKKLSDLRRAA